MIPHDSVDFYPTPDSLADELARSVMPANEFGRLRSYPGPILEPSAGTGNLAFALERACDIRRNDKGQFLEQRGGATHESPHKRKKDRKLDLDVIELSESFRAVLRDKGLRVVHDDFLTFRPTKKYWAIVMNPPFSQGAAHLLKALEIQKDGGLVRCILNAETIRNPCTNERKELVAQLEKLGATITYRKDAFSNGLRRSNVEIAIVAVDIPDKEPVSRIRLELKQEMTDRLSQDPQLAALVSSDPIQAAIERYNAAAEGLRRLYAEFDGIKSLMIPNPQEDAPQSLVRLNKSYNEAIHDLRLLYWRTLFDLPAIRDNLTSSMRYDYQKRLDELADYDFTAYNILTIREEISKNLLHGIEQEIIKLFDTWTNLHYSEYSKNIHYFNGWCTNEAYKVGKRVIFYCDAFSSWSGRFDPLYNVQRTLESIEMILFHLDTNGMPYSSQELEKTLKKAMTDGQTRGIQLRYFTVTFYKKGTCHIEFTNADVLKSFNLFACQRKGWLPPSYGKKTYRDMGAADKKVVDSYEGESSYTDSLTRGLIPTDSTLLRLAAAQ